MLTPRIIAVPTVPRGAIFAFHVTLNTWAYAAFALSFVLSVIYLVQDRVLRSRRLSVAFWRFPALDVLERMARSSVYVGLVALVFGVAMGLIWEHRLSGSYSFGDPKVIVTLAILGGVCGVPAAFAQRELARRARGAALRDEFRDRAVQLHVREFVSHEVSPVLLMPTATNPNRAGAIRIQVALIGCNHRTAPVELRERIAFTSQQALQAADELTRARNPRRSGGAFDVQSQRAVRRAGRIRAVAPRSDGRIFHFVPQDSARPN